MKRLLPLLLAVCSGYATMAQPWVPKGANNHLKLRDLMARYPLYAPKTGEQDAEEEREREREEERKRGGTHKESKDHLYEKWAWYWKQHCDDAGYMVSPVKNMREWLKASKAKGAAKTTAIPANWTFQGPTQSMGGYSGIGRINTIAFDPVDTNTFYIGSPGGGTWKTTNNAASWTPLYSNLPTLGVADIKINPLNHNTIFVATGDGDAGDAFSSGVIKSTDGGATWSTAGLSWLATDYYAARSLLINPVDTNSLLLGTNIGLFKSTNAGVTWTNVASGDYKQLLYNPADTSIVYASVYTSTSAQLLRSADGGMTWVPATSFTDVQRIAMAICPAASNVVVALASNNESGLHGIYTSVDNGISFTPTFTDDASCANNMLGYDLGLPATSCGGQGWYDLCIAIDPVNVNNITIGGVNNYFSSDGGLSWTLVTQWYGGLAGVETVHADKHYLGYNPLNHALYEGCDGGIYRTYDPLLGDWTDLSNGLGITEFYRNAVDNGVSWCIGGAQDNGTKKVDGGVATDLTGGDGMQPLINYGDPANIFYCAYQNGAVDMTRDGGASFHSITDMIGESGDWITPYLLHPTDTATLFLGYKKVYVSHDNGNSWTDYSPVFDTSYNINFMAISTKNPLYLYTVTNDYNIWRSVIHYTTDGGVSWNTFATVPYTRFFSDITVDPKNENKIYLTLSGYGSGKVVSYNLLTPGWSSESGGLPDMPVNCIVIDTITRTKYVGTDAAVYYKDTTMSSWVLFNTHLPAVHVTDLSINYALSELWAATYGRGMWKTGRADHPVGIPSAPMVADAITVSPNPSHGAFTITATGTGFKNGAVAIKLTGSDGKVQYTSTATFDSCGAIHLDVKGLPPGFYICEVGNKQLLARTRVVLY